MNRQWAKEIYEKINAKLKAECVRNEHVIPHISHDGRYRDIDNYFGISGWTNGFWPGMLWQMYNASGDGQFRAIAESVEKRMDEALVIHEDLCHDIGFMWLHTSAANYRLTGNKDSRRRGLHAANLLAGRYNPAGRFIRAWNDPSYIGWIIIDCMMNLPLLYWASEESGDPRFKMIAMEHASTTIQHLVRPDGSCNHIAALSPHTGQCLEIPDGQGFAPGSSWSRGQAWALYGFALSFRHSGSRQYLDAAKKIAHYIIANCAASDWLPPVDFRSPSEPVKYDSTAAMISACGLLEISRHIGEYEKALYADAAYKLLTAGEKAFADWNPETDGIIGKGAFCYHCKPEDIEHYIIYGDYFFTEAILRLLEKDFLIW